jgi:capsular exopolysaccharide synthesis family protein
VFWLPAAMRPEPLTDDERRQAILQSFADQLEVTPIRNTQLVKIAFYARDPQLAADIINTLGRVYIDSDIDARVDMTRQAATWITGRMAGLREQLEQSEKALQDYREQENLLEVGGVRTLASQELNELTSKMVEARRKRTEAENVVAQIDQDPSSNPAVLQHPLVQRLKEQESLAEQNLSEMSKRYGPKHPKIIAATGELQAARKSYEQQVANVVEGVRREYQIALAGEAAMSQALAGMKNQMQDINRKEYRLNELERTVTVNRQLYDTFFSRMKETSETENLQTVHAKIIDRAIAPNNPSQPKMLLWLLAAAGIGLLAGVGLALLREELDNTLNNPDDVRNRLGESLLGVLPLLKDSEITRKGVATIFGRNNLSSFAEAIRSIRTTLLVSDRDAGQLAARRLSVLVSSAEPGEGKSVLASNLAAAFGQLGKTLLVDADLRRPAAERNFRLKALSFGLADLLAGKATPGQCIQHLERWQIDVLPAGKIPLNPLELLSSDRFPGLIAQLQQEYDYIVIDSAPCEAVSDAMVLSAFVEAVVYVVHAGRTDRRAIATGIQRLRAAGAPLKGIVLNRVDIERGKRAGYYYSGHDSSGLYYENDQRESHEKPSPERISRVVNS